MSPADSQILLVVWVSFTVITILGLGAVFIWAVRSRQFTGQDRARYLPLLSGIPVEDELPGRTDGPGSSREDQCSA